MTGDTGVTFDSVSRQDHDALIFVSDERTGLRGVISIYNSGYEQAVGGTRIMEYESTNAAVEDALRLSKSMAYKIALTDYEYGGAKAVLRHDPDDVDTDLLHSYGTQIENLNGQYNAGIDMNTSAEILKTVGEKTEYVWGESTERGGDITACGVIRGMELALRERGMGSTFEGVSVAVQGFGKVGSCLVDRLLDSGADVTVADVRDDRVAEARVRDGVRVVDPDRIVGQNCDIFAPCAVGGVIDIDSVERLNCDIVAGCANNPLTSTHVAHELHRAGILYVPSYVINTGGFIAGAVERNGKSIEDAYTEVVEASDSLIPIFERADANEQTTLEAAEEYVQSIL